MTRRTIIVGGLLVVLLVGTVSAVFTTTQDSTSATRPQDTKQPSMRNGSIPFPVNCSRMPGQQGFCHAHLGGFIPLCVTLTQEQRDELNTTIATLRQQNATPQDIRIAIQEKLDEFGVYDAQLNATIAATEQRLTILNREKELRSQGYNWTTIDTMIAQEFGQNATATGNPWMTPGHAAWREEPRGGCRPHQ